MRAQYGVSRRASVARHHARRTAGGLTSHLEVEGSRDWMGHRSRACPQAALAHLRRLGSFPCAAHARIFHSLCRLSLLVSERAAGTGGGFEFQVGEVERHAAVPGNAAAHPFSIWTRAPIAASNEPHRAL